MLRRATRALRRALLPIASPRPFRPLVFSRRRVVSLLLVAPVTFAFLACQPGEGASEDSLAARAPGDAAREFAIAVDRERPNLTVKDWKGETGERDVALTGYALGDTLRLVREVVTGGDREKSASRYYFDGAQLRYYESTADVTSGQPPAPHKERLVLAFDKLGVAVEISHQMDGATAPVDSVRISGVQARAAELARQWATTPPASKD